MPVESAGGVPVELVNDVTIVGPNSIYLDGTGIFDL